MFDILGKSIAQSRFARLPLAGFGLSLALTLVLGGSAIWYAWGQGKASAAYFAFICCVAALLVLVQVSQFRRMRDESGEIKGYAKLTRDMTDRKQAEEALCGEIMERQRIAADLEALNQSLASRISEGTEALQQSRLRLVGILDSAMDGIVTVNDTQQIVLFNRAAECIFGWSAEQAIGQPLEVLIPQRFQGAHRGYLQRFGSTGSTSRRMGDGTVIHGLRANGEEFPLDASISQLDTSVGKLFTVILRDVTERVLAQEELSAFAAEASAVREQEKARVARELHDELAQSLTAVKMDTVWLRDNLNAGPAAAEGKLNAMLSMLDGSIAATRRIAADLRPLLLDDLGLAPAIEWLVQNFIERTGVACTLDMDEDLDLPEPYATAVFRIVQESLANVAKHAAATKVEVGVVKGPLEVTLRVRDNGRGFDPAEPRKMNSLGLAGVRERARLLRSTARVESARGTGALIEVRIPLDATGEPV